MAKFCAECVQENVDSANFCKSCGAKLIGMTNDSFTSQLDFEVPIVEKSYTAALVLGYVFSILIPLIGVIIGVYLITRKDSPKANRHAKYILIISVVVWILSILSIFR